MLTAVVGINWGDEGKGRMVDLLSAEYDVICRYQGGNNAGHTVVNERGKFILNLLPSGILRDNVVNVMGNGMVIDLEHLCGEMEALRSKGIKITPETLKISDKAIICMPYHRQQDILEEERLAERKYGSTRRGIAPVYGDKYMKKGLRMGDLLAPETLADKVANIVEWKNITFSGYGQEKLSPEAMVAWLKQYGEPLLGEKKPEKYIETSPVPGYASIYFNSEPENELSQTRLDSKIMELISRAETSLDLGMFSFTRPELAQALLAQAKRYPDAKFRILLDHAQMHDENPDESKLAPWLESEAERLGIENIEIRYRFRKNAYSYNPETGKTELLSYLSKFWHHKNITVNDSEMIVGSYNWSNSAEYINYENLVFFNGAFEGHADVIRRFKAEFDALFEASEGRKNSKGVYCRTVTLKEGRAEFKKISEALKLDDAYKAQSALGRDAVKDFDTLLQETGMSRKKLQKVLDGLVRAGILTRTETDGKTLYKQAD